MAERIFMEVYDQVKDCADVFEQKAKREQLTKFALDFRPQ